MTRDEFREAVFLRDGHKCVICHEQAQDAHHVIERRLFDNGGYDIDNGVSLCGRHHILAEQTVLSCEDLRTAAGVQRLVLPIQLDKGGRYDKWGNMFMPSGQRMRGELFEDVSVQAILRSGGVLNTFAPYVKFPKIDHFPWSEGADPNSDRLMSQADVAKYFEGQEVVVGEKLDGENTSCYRDLVHARSIDGRSHPSRDWMKKLHSSFCYDIPENWRVCGENVFAEHSIHYNGLPSYFFVFAIYDQFNHCLPWTETAEYAKMLGLETMPVLYRGPFNVEAIKKLFTGKSAFGTSEQEGYVGRMAGKIRWPDHRRSFAKFVRKGHVRTHGHWMHGAITRNELKEGVSHENRA